MVIAASDSAGAVARTVASLALEGWSDPARFEVIVAAARDRIDPEAALERVRWLTAEAGAGVPRLRRLGLDAGAAPLVAFTEDSCRLGPIWVDAWRQAFHDPRVQAATGPVAPAMGDSPLDWAVFFCEYGPFLPSGRAGLGPPGRLAGNNFAIRRGLARPRSIAPRSRRRRCAAWWSKAGRARPDCAGTGGPRPPLRRARGVRRPAPIRPGVRPAPRRPSARDPSTPRPRRWARHPRGPGREAGGDRSEPSARSGTVRALPADYPGAAVGVERRRVAGLADRTLPSVVRVQTTWKRGPTARATACPSRVATRTL